MAAHKRVCLVPFLYDDVTTFLYLRNAVICQQFNHFIIAEFLSVLNKT